MNFQNCDGRDKHINVIHKTKSFFLPFYLIQTYVARVFETWERWEHGYECPSRSFLQICRKSKRSAEKNLAECSKCERWPGPSVQNLCKQRV